MNKIVRLRLLAVLVSLFCGVGLLAVAQKKATPKPDPDEAALARAKKAGYDLSKPYKLWFRLTVSPSCDYPAAINLQAAGFAVTIWPKGSVGTIVIARKTMVPDLAVLQKIRQDFKSVCDADTTPTYYVSWGFVTDRFDGMTILK